MCAHVYREAGEEVSVREFADVWIKQSCCSRIRYIQSVGPLGTPFAKEDSVACRLCLVAG
jgi:hypothetical protein